MFKRGLSSWLVVLGVSYSGAALAQSGEPAVEPSAEPSTAAPGVDPTPQDGAQGPTTAAPGVDPTPEDARQQGQEPVATVGDSDVETTPLEEGEVDTEILGAHQGNSAVELPGKTYHFIGARYRTIVIPKFLINLFADGGTTVVAHNFGPEYAIRKDSFEYVFSLSYASYAMDDTPFKSSSDGEKAWEIVRSDLKALYLTAEFLWSQQFTPVFALNYGGGAGLGYMFGNINRVQAYPRAGSQGNPEDYERCVGKGSPDPVFCGTENEHYGDYNEPSWADGGSKPIVFPWIAFQTGLRIKPSKHFVARIDLGVGTSGAFLGLGVDYGL